MFVKAGVKTACLTILAQTHDNVIDNAYKRLYRYIVKGVTEI